MNRRLLLAGIVVLLAFGGLFTWHSGWGVPLVAATSPRSSREYGAALLGLLVLAFIAFGMDWQGGA